MELLFPRLGRCQGVVAAALRFVAFWLQERDQYEESKTSCLDCLLCLPSAGFRSSSLSPTVSSASFQSCPTILERREKGWSSNEQTLVVRIARLGDFKM